MEIKPVNRIALVQKRNQLIAQSLRPEDMPFSIEDEYPIVLNPQLPQYSYCMAQDDEVIAHANIWPRTVTFKENKPDIKVGLIGNVATEEKWRGQGIMRKLLNQMESEAKKLNLSALILWSDLAQFYQNLGFTSLGTERRIEFRLKNFKPYERYLYTIIDPSSFKSYHFSELLELRPQSPCTINRGISEYRQLSKIPAMGIFVTMTGNHVESFLICGKGADMAGVVHEWGGPPDLIIQGLWEIMNLLRIEQITLLAPSSLGPDYRERFSGIGAHESIHPMAIGKAIQPQFALNNLQELFVWGLDSI